MDVATAVVADEEGLRHAGAGNRCRLDRRGPERQDRRNHAGSGERDLRGRRVPVGCEGQGRVPRAHGRGSERDRDGRALTRIEAERGGADRVVREGHGCARDLEPQGTPVSGRQRQSGVLSDVGRPEIELTRLERQDRRGGHVQGGGHEELLVDRIVAVDLDPGAVRAAGEDAGAERGVDVRLATGGYDHRYGRDRQPVHRLDRFIHHAPQLRQIVPGSIGRGHVCRLGAAE